jgi:5-methylcytosine-specific restriction endonuclease McrA
MNGHGRGAGEWGCRYVECVLLSAVFDRDDGACWLCGGVALLDPPKSAITYGVTGAPKPIPHPELATFDHVVPLSAGGEHSYAHIRLAT